MVDETSKIQGFGVLEMVRKLRPEERELWKKVADTATPTRMPALAAT
ncbi:MAG: hypothetical protein ACI9W7_001455, partial [Porticoccaceae bacterium]